MRLQANRISGRLSLCDLPILPFLAPRVFTLWSATPQSRSVYTNTQEARKCAKTNEHSKNIPVEVCSFGARRSKGSADSPETPMDSGTLRNAMCYQGFLEPCTPEALYTAKRNPAPKIFCDTNPGEYEFEKLRDGDWDSLGGTRHFPPRQRLYSKNRVEIGESAVTGGVSPEQEGGHIPSMREISRADSGIRGVVERMGKLLKDRVLQKKNLRTNQVGTSKRLFQKRGRNNVPNGVVSGIRSCHRPKGHCQTRYHPVKGRLTRCLQTKAYMTRYLLVCRRTRLRRLHHLWSGRFLKRRNMIEMKINLEDSELVKSFLSWRVRFAYIFQQLGTGLAQPPLRNVEDIKLFQTVENVLSEASSEAFFQTWEGFDVSKRAKLWQKFMLEFLHKDPTSGLKFLVLTCKQPPPPFYAITDSLEYISNHFLHDVNIGVIFSKPLFMAVLRLFEDAGYGYFYLTQNTIRRLLRYLDPEEIERFYVTLIRNRNPMSRDILKFVAYILAHRGRTDLAVDVLQRLYDAGANFNKLRIKYTCAMLLRKKNYHDSGSEISDSDLFAFMLSLGLQPDILFYNILIQNSLEAGDRETAWQIHDMMLDSGIDTDAYTYSHLLRDAKLRMDRSKIEDILRIIESRGIISGHILNDILHAMFLFSEYEKGKYLGKTGPRYTFDKILEFYSKHFQVAPLIHFVPGLDPKQSGFNVHPSKVTLCFMITSYIKGLDDDHSILEWYKSFRKLVVEGHPSTRELVTTSHIYDAVIMCLGRFPERLGQCREIIDDMVTSFEKCPGIGDGPGKSQHGLPGDHDTISCGPEDRIPWSNARIQALWASGTSAHDDHSLAHCAPSACTWSILLRAYMHHGQPQAAENVLSTMRSHGMNPTDMSWYSLAAGYIRMQDIPNTVDAIRRLENEGHTVDEKLMSRLRTMRDRRALIQAMLRRHEKNTPIKDLYNSSQGIDEPQDEGFLKQFLSSVDKAGRTLIVVQSALRSPIEPGAHQRTRPKEEQEILDQTAG